MDEYVKIFPIEESLNSVQVGVQRMQRRIELLEKENKSLKDEISHLRNDYFLIEKIK